MPKPDEGHILTEKELAKLEKRIAKLYGDTAKEMQSTIDEYFDSFAKRDEEMRSLIGSEVNGKEWTKEDYKKWRLNQIGRGKRLEALRDKIAERVTNANETAVAYVNDATPGIYSLNRNYAAYTIEQISPNADFTLWDEQTVKRLVEEQPDLMPYYPKAKALKRGIDLEYGKKQITASITSSILQGKSIKHIADDLQDRITTMSRVSAIRTARTAITEAQNAGRMDSYKAAEGMGIKLKKCWLATLDGRTRHSHAMLDGQTVDTDKPFKVDGYEIMYPGDGSAPGYLVYNCFVGETQIASDSGIVRSYKQEYNGELIEIETSSGVKFTCTPNHPILTPNGWVAATLLDNGDNLLIASRGNGRSFRLNGNIEHIHSRMKTFYNTLHCFGFVSRDTTLRVNFHGDIPTTNVEVITKEWKLRGNRNTSLGNCINKFLLKNSNKPFVRKGTLMEHFGSVRTSTLSLISRFCKLFSFLRRCLSHSGVHGFRAVANMNISVSKPTINDLPTDVKFFGKPLDGLTCEVFADNIVSIDRSVKSCHVYNLQTENGYYFVNTSIPQNSRKCNGNFAIAHNCRCTTIAVLDDVDTSDALRRDQYGLMPDMTFAQWENQKRGEGALQR